MSEKGIEHFKKTLFFLKAHQLKKNHLFNQIVVSGCHLCQDHVSEVCLYGQTII